MEGLNTPGATGASCMCMRMTVKGDVLDFSAPGGGHYTAIKASRLKRPTTRHGLSDRFAWPPAKGSKG